MMLVVTSPMPELMSASETPMKTRFPSFVMRQSRTSQAEFSPPEGFGV